MHNHTKDLIGAVAFFTVLALANWLYQLVQSLPVHH